MIQALTLILVCELIGEATVLVTGLPIPGPVLGMLLLLAWLGMRDGVSDELDRTSSALLGADRSTLLSLAPKSVTAPVAMGIAEKLGGYPSLTAVLVVVTGILGAVLGTSVFRLLRIHDHVVCGVAMGVTSHGIGTARAFQISRTMGAFSGLAMALSAFATALLLPVLLHWLGLVG